MYWLFGDDQRQPARHLKPGERDDEGLEPEAGRDRRPAPRRRPRRRRRRTAAVGISPQPPVVMMRRGQHAATGSSSAPTERSMPAVMMTKVMPTRDDAGLRDRAHDIGDVVGREKEDHAVPARREDDAADRHQNEPDHALEADEKREQVERGAWPAARRPRREVVAVWLIRFRPRFARRAASTLMLVAPRREIPRPCGRRAARRPGRTGRAARASRSTRRARPCPCRELADAGVDLALGADVDAARRLVEQEQARVAEHFLGDDDLLLVAARERADDELGPGRAHVEGR